MPPKKLKTRHSTGKCFGPASDLPDDGDLYTHRDVLAAVEKVSETFPEKHLTDVADIIAPKIVMKWKQANPELVLIADKSLKTKIVRAYSTAEDIRLKKLNKKQRDIFFGKLDKLFDILVCHCPISVCPGELCSRKTCPGFHVDCKCEVKDKIPVIELEFIKDQRDKVGHKGNMQLAGPDRVEARRQAENRKKKASLEAYYESQTVKQGQKRAQTDDYEQENLDLPDVNVDDKHDGVDFEYVDKDDNSSKDHNQNRINILPYIAEVERYFISDRAASALYNAALKTVGMITAEDTKNVVDKSKIIRSRASYRAAEKSKKVNKIKDLGGLGCVGVDGKRDRKSKKIVIEVINGEEVEKKKLVLKNI